MTDVAAETFVAPTAAAEPVVEAVAEPVAAPAPAAPAAPAAAPVTADRGLAEVLGFSFVKEDTALFAPYVSRGRDLVLWRHPTTTGAVLGGSLAALVASAYLSWDDALRIGAGLAFTVVVLNLVYVGAVKLTKAFFGGANTRALEDEHPHAALLAQARHLQVDEAAARTATTMAVTAAGVATRSAASVLLAEDLGQSLRAAAALYLLWTVSTWFSAKTLIGLSVIVLFTVPAAYDQNREIVDKQLAIASEMVDQQLGNIKSRAIGIRADIMAKFDGSAAKKQE
ncbi:reticulon-like protein of the endoplasmic reticulum [Allomyces javanicus]|nr:reticulon-like protein of the endoplasmic reticulum [Allomyces javanicus]